MARIMYGSDAHHAGSPVRRIGRLAPGSLDGGYSPGRLKSAAADMLQRAEGGGACSNRNGADGIMPVG